MKRNKFLIIIPILSLILMQQISTKALKDDFKTEKAQKIILMSKAADINVTLDTNMDPCENFYEYACGNWHRHSPAQLFNNIITDKFLMLARAFDRRLEQLLMEPTNTSTNASDEMEDIELLDKMRNFYASCRNEQKNATVFTRQLVKIYKEFGMLPVLAGENWNEGSFQLWETLAKIHQKYGIQIIIAVEIMADIKNSKKNAVYLRPADLRPMGAKTKIRSVLQESTTVRDLQKYFSIDEDLATTAATEMIEFERELNEGATDAHFDKGLPDLLINKKLEDIEPHIKKFLSTILEDKVPDSVYIYDMKFFENMAQTIQTKSNEILANYVLWRLLQDFLIDANDNNISRFCTAKTKKYFGKLVDHELYKRYKQTQQEEEIFQIWRKIRKAFRDELSGNKLDWISNTTREYALKKLDAMVLQINSYNKVNFVRKYENLEIEGDCYVKNVQQILMHESRKQLAKLNTSAVVPKIDDNDAAIKNEDADQINEDVAFDNDDVVMSNDDVAESDVENVGEIDVENDAENVAENDENDANDENDDAAPELFSITPVYNKFKNSIKIPVALLQPYYFWEANYPQAIKYATLGTLIAREMIHGFDDVGRSYDLDGNNRTWWDKRSSYEFEERRKCFQAQYHGYKYTGYDLPDLTDQDNIADNAAVKLAYAAYMNWVEEQQAAIAVDSSAAELDMKNVIKSEKLPGLYLENKQLFFVSYAQVWCDDVQSLIKSSMISSDTYAPGTYRVIGSLSNFQEFAWVFKCKQDAIMDPDYKCTAY